MIFFDTTDEQRELQRVARRFFTAHAPLADTRRLAETDSGYDERVWRRLAGELGVHGLLVPERFGGAGFRFLEMALVLEEAGYALLPGPFFATAVLAASCLAASDDDAVRERFLPMLASGDLVASVALNPEAELGAAARARTSGSAWRLAGVAEFVPDGEAAGLVLVAAQSADGPVVLAVEKDAPGLSVEPLPVLDRTRRMARLRFADTPAVPLGAPGDAQRMLARTAEAAAVGLAAEQVGGMRRCLDLTVDYAKLRVQFGRPIGGFQSVKHLCADMYALLESARSAMLYAAWAVASGSDEAALLASLAKAYCSDAFLKVAGDAIQVHGAIGFTWEHDCHLFFKRATAGKQLLGSPTTHRDRVAQLLAF